MAQFFEDVHFYMKSIIYTVLVLLSHSAVAQLPYTNVANHVAHNSDPSIEVVGDNYYVANIINDITDQWFHYVKYDTLGMVLDTLKIHYDPLKYFNTNCKKCFEFHRGSFYHAFNTNWHDVPGTDSVSTLIIKIKGDLSDTVKLKLYNTGLRNFTAVTDLEFDSDSTFLMSMFHGFYNGTDPQIPGYWKVESVVSRIDTSLNILWEVKVPDLDSNRNNGISPSKLILDQNGGVIVVGPDQHFSTASSYEGLAFRLDITTGQLLWRRSFIRQRGINGMYGVNNGDGTIQFVQNFSTSPGQLNDRLNVGLMDTSGNVLSQKQYYWGGRSIVAEDIIKLKDGSYYVSGVYDYSRGLGFKFTRNLDSLWATSYSYPFTSGISNVDAFLQDSSGMLVHTGWTTTNDIDNWLFRIDIQGCDTSNCGLKLFENVQPNNYLTVFPNPCGQICVVDIDQMSSFIGARLMVTDVMGRLIQDNLVSSSREEIRFPHPGFYVVQLIDSHGNIIGIEKVSSNF